MGLPILAKAQPRPERAKSIADLLARQRGVVPRTNDSPVTPPDPVSLPFGGLSPEQLAHDAWVSTQRIVPTQFRSVGSKLVPYQREEIAEYEPIESVEGEVIEPERLERVDSPEPKPSEAQAEAPVTHVHVHLHEAPKPRPSGFPLRARSIPPGSPEAKPIIAASVAKADAAIADSNKFLQLPRPTVVEPV